MFDLTDDAIPVDTACSCLHSNLCWPAWRDKAMKHLDCFASEQKHADAEAFAMERVEGLSAGAAEG